MALAEVVVSSVAGIIVAVIAKIGMDRSGKGKDLSVKKEDIITHDIYSTLLSWKVESIKALRVTDSKKTAVMQRYAKTVVESYLKELTTLKTTLSKDNVIHLPEFYLQMVQSTHDALYASGIPEIYIQQVYEYTSALRDGVFKEVQLIESSGKSYFDKVYSTLGLIKFFIGTLLEGLPHNTLHLNGTFEKALETWHE